DDLAGARRIGHGRARGVGDETDPARVDLGPGDALVVMCGHEAPGDAMRSSASPRAGHLTRRVSAAGDPFRTGYRGRTASGPGQIQANNFGATTLSRADNSIGAARRTRHP